MKKYKVGILGATGMVGQRFIHLLEQHPWLEVTTFAASPRSAGKPYQEVMEGKWKMTSPMPSSVKNIQIQSAIDDKESIAQEVDFVFSAVDLDKQTTQSFEEAYASLGIPVVSNNAAHRWTEDIPMILPEVNAHHLAIIPLQQKKRGWDKGFIVVKPNCSLQSYTIIFTALKQFVPKKIHVTSLQAISGAGKNFETWPEMTDNVIPFIGGEEEKSKKEPLKIWGEIRQGKISPARYPSISATCIRVPVTDGHPAQVSVTFAKKPTRDEILNAIEVFNQQHPLLSLELPSSPQKLIQYFIEESRPQTRLDRDYANGMGITMGRLREDELFDYSFISLAHNTVRGAAGRAILTAELLVKKGYIA